MSYPIKCVKHGTTNAANILKLIESHTDRAFGNNGGMIVCPECKEPATIFREYDLQEKERWKCWIRGIVRIPTEIKTYVPYVLFTTDEERGKRSDGVMISYYKNTREDGGRLKHGHGPGGPAVLGKRELISLLTCLVQSKVLSRNEVLRAIDHANGLSG